MRADEVEQKAATRAEPLPEEAAVQEPDENRRGEAEEILAESEERVDEAARAATPADAAEEHRRSEDAAG